MECFCKEFPHACSSYLPKSIEVKSINYEYGNCHFIMPMAKNVVVSLLLIFMQAFDCYWYFETYFGKLLNYANKQKVAANYLETVEATSTKSSDIS